MRGMLPEKDDFRAALGLLPEDDEQAIQRKFEEMRYNMPSTVMRDAQHRLYDEMRKIEDERPARNRAYYEREPYLTEEDLMNEAIQYHIRNRNVYSSGDGPSGGEGFHRYAILVPHAVAGRSEKNRRRNEAKDEAKTRIRNLGGRIFYMDEYPVDEYYMRIVYLYIIGYPTYFTGLRF